MGVASTATHNCAIADHLLLPSPLAACSVFCTQNPRVWYLYPLAPLLIEPLEVSCSLIPPGSGHKTIIRCRRDTGEYLITSGVPICCFLPLLWKLLLHPFSLGYGFGSPGRWLCSSRLATLLMDRHLSHFSRVQVLPTPMLLPILASISLGWAQLPSAGAEEHWPLLDRTCAGPFTAGTARSTWLL